MSRVTHYDREELHRDGNIVVYHRYRAPQADTALVVLPAMGVPAGYYGRLAKQLVAEGHDVTVLDWRGTGDSSPPATRRSLYGYLDLVDDAEVLMSRLAPELTGSTVTLLGHSLGGHIAGLLLARWSRIGHHPADRLCLVACGVPYHRLYGGRGIGVYALAAGMRLTAAAVGHWPGYGFAGRQSRGVVRDWAHTVRTGYFNDRELDTAIAEVKLPILAVTVDGDQFTPPVTTRHLTAKFSGADITEVHYSHSAAGADVDHFTWARHPQGLLPTLSAFARGR